MHGQHSRLGDVCTTWQDSPLPSIQPSGLHIVQVSLLAAAIVLGQWLKRRKVEWFGEAAGAICLGIAMGLLLRLYGVGPHFKDIMAFKVLAPPPQSAAWISAQNTSDYNTT
jgi:hypothetical protein